MMDEHKSKNWFARHKILSIILALILVGIIASAANGGNKSNNNQTQPTNNNSAQSSTNSTPKKQEQLARIGENARDGKFEFTVKSIDCGKSVVGPNQYLQKTAQGQFCLLTLDVKNIGDQQQTFSESDQKLLNNAKQQYSADTTATLYNSNNSDAFLAQINPGNTVEGVLVFDIPKDQTPVTAELHDSPFSSGVKVSLQ